MDNGVGKRLGITISLSLSAGGGETWLGTSRLGGTMQRGGVFFLN